MKLSQIGKLISFIFSYFYGIPLKVFFDEWKDAEIPTWKEKVLRIIVSREYAELFMNRWKDFLEKIYEYARSIGAEDVIKKIYIIYEIEG